MHKPYRWIPAANTSSFFGNVTMPFINIPALVDTIDIYTAVSSRVVTSGKYKSWIAR